MMLKGSKSVSELAGLNNRRPLFPIQCWKPGCNRIHRYPCCLASLVVCFPRQLYLRNAGQSWVGVTAGLSAELHRCF